MCEVGDNGEEGELRGEGVKLDVCEGTKVEDVEDEDLGWLAPEGSGRGSHSPLSRDRSDVVEEDEVVDGNVDVVSCGEEEEEEDQVDEESLGREDEVDGGIFVSLR